MKKRKHNGHIKGFTLVEVLTVVSIMIFIAGISWPSLDRFYQAAKVATAAADLEQALRLAQMRSIAGFNNDAYGIHFETDASPCRATAYRGPSYSGRVTGYDEGIACGGGIAFATDMPGQEINFSRGFGRPSNTGQITVNGQNGPFKTVAVNGYGMAGIID